MRAEIEVAEAARLAPRFRPEVVPAPARRFRFDFFELGVLAVFGAVSLWVLGLDLWQVLVHGRTWTGTDGFYLVDQMQYLAWIREASDHLLASNLFVLRPTPADYFQPAVAISGGLSALGVAPWMALLLWKPIAVGGAFYTVRAYVRRTVRGLWARRAALVLGLFFGSFAVVYGSFGVVADLAPGFLSWGYTFGLIALAAMLGGLLAYDRARTSGQRMWLPPLLGALASALHPWQGELLILILIGTELTMWRLRRDQPPRLRLAFLTASVTALPLAYYMILGRVDPSWQLARDASKHSFSLLTIALAIGPLMVPASFGYRRRRVDFLAGVTRVWPLAALVIFVLSATALSATPLHAFEGITVPLAVLSVEGVRRKGWSRTRGRRVLAGLAVAAAVIPATAYELRSAISLAAPSPGNANFITADESRALAFLARDPTSGGVLTRFYLGSVVPAATGRRTLVGNCLWSQPDCPSRAKLAQRLFDGSLAPEVSRSLVQLTGARFVLSDCQVPGNLGPALAPIVESVHRFGCATVYELDGPSPPVGPLAESGAHAALRASGRQQRYGQRS